MSSDWPRDWADRVAGTTCEMCLKQGLIDNEYGVLVHAGKNADAFLQRAALAPGYTIMIWKRDHTVELTSLSYEQVRDYWTDVVNVARAIMRLFSPIKMNYVTLGNVVPHLHTHIVPRFFDDAAPGGSLPMDTSELESWPEDDFQRQVAQIRDLITQSSDS